MVFTEDEIRVTIAALTGYISNAERLLREGGNACDEPTLRGFIAQADSAIDELWGELERRRPPLGPRRHRVTLHGRTGFVEADIDLRREGIEIIQIDRPSLSFLVGALSRDAYICLDRLGATVEEI